MKRRTLDVIFSVGGVLFAALLLILGLVLSSQGSFAKDYVADQFAQQKITFIPEEALSGEQDAPGGDCLVEFAGTELSTGKHAECYANQFIAFHMAESATELAAETGNPAYEGATYATLGGITRGLSASIAEGTEAGDDVSALEEELAAANGLRDSMFRGETLRGLLLTTYGFSIFGERADQAAMVAYAAAVLLLLLSIAGFVHAMVTPKDKKVLVVDEPTSVNKEPLPV
jgi:hypothetical protein